MAAISFIHMIQRIQTVLLFLAAALCVAFLFLPTWLVSNPGIEDGNSKTILSTPMGVSVESSEMGLNAFSSKTMGFSENTFLLLQFGLTCLTAALLLLTIFLYSNRPLQVKLGYVSLLMLMGINVLMIPIRNWLQEMGGDPGLGADFYQSVPRWGLAATFVALLLVWFAVKRIQHDEKLVKGMDRMR